MRYVLSNAGNDFLSLHKPFLLLTFILSTLYMEVFPIIADHKMPSACITCPFHEHIKFIDLIL